MASAEHTVRVGEMARCQPMSTCTLGVEGRGSLGGAFPEVAPRPPRALSAHAACIEASCAHPVGCADQLIGIRVASSVPLVQAAGGNIKMTGSFQRSVYNKIACEEELAAPSVPREPLQTGRPRLGEWPHPGFPVCCQPLALSVCDRCLPRF